MVLESTIICVDNSDFMRNGDFLPTRLAAQQDAVNVVCNAKTRGNPENNVGLLTMAGKRVEVLSTLTTDTGRIMAKLHLVRPEGNISFSAAIRVAHLALKHRQGKNHKTRIVAFVGSPVEENDKDLEKLAKKLKKEKVNVDVVNFGEDSSNTEKLNVFVTTLNGKEGQTSHLITVPPGTGTALSDVLFSSPIVRGEDGGGVAVAGGAGGGRDFDFGVDADADPELALALRVSMEEQRQRQEDEARKNAAAPKERQPAIDEDEDEDEEAAQLAAALALSQQGGGGSTGPIPSLPDFATMSEEEQIAMAMQMSLQSEESAAAESPVRNPPGAPRKPKREDNNENKNNSEDRKRPRESEGSAGGSNPPTPGRKGNEEKKPRVVTGEEAHNSNDEEDYSEVMNDPAFLQSVLENLPGVDPQSDAIKDAVNSLNAGEAKKKKEDKKGNDK